MRATSCDLRAQASTRKQRNSDNKNTGGFTALHYTAIFNHPELARVLLTADAGLADTRDDADWTARDVANMHGNLAVVEVMDEMGAVSGNGFDEIGQQRGPDYHRMIDAHIVRELDRKDREFAAEQFVERGDARWPDEHDEL